MIENPWPPLDEATEAALRASIERFGVLVPILLDQHGGIIDGHHRARLAGELGLEPRVEVIEVRDNAHARALATTLNSDRRHLDVWTRRKVVESLRSEGHSERAIAGAVGVTKTTVHRDLETLGGPGGPPAQIAGRDGKNYAPARRKRASKIRRLPASPSWARVLTNKLRDIGREVKEAQAWVDKGHKPPPETFERLSATRDAAAKLARDLDRLLGERRHPDVDVELTLVPRQGAYNPHGDHA
jgi:ParB-like chromosome segregation protein Spo0J